ncbi:MAG: 4Fe-4S binding protein [Slackia sp.]|nr:4Fe-4S binding protein [Slackia sp.]
MPSVMDMVEIMERLESKALHIDPPHCVRVRNRNASCSRCVDACPSGAITLRGNALEIDAQQCMGCGACATACPTSAIRFRDPDDIAVAEAFDRSARALGGAAVAVCARVAAKHKADVDAVATVPCVSRLGADALVGACARGASSVTVVDGVCATCKYRRATVSFDETVREANELLALWGSPARVRRSQEVPAAACAQSAEQAMGGVSRRGFFTAAKASMKDVAAEAVAVTLESELGIKRDEKSLRAMLKVDSSGTMPHVEPYAHDALMEYLYQLGEPASDAVVSTRLWGDVHIDESACMMCGMCATFCPTGALRKVFVEGEKRPVLDSLEFRLADCVQCRLCEDACIRKALKVGSDVTCDRILEFEPRVFRGEKKKAKGSLFGGKR